MPAEDAALLIAGLAPHILEADRSGNSRNPRL
jgi:hypothetical protein